MNNYINKYKSMNVYQLINEVKRLKNLTIYDDTKIERLEYLAKEILIKA